MRQLVAAVDLADVLCFLGAACVGLTVYWLWPVFTPAYVGLVFIAAGILRVAGRHPDTAEPRR